MFISIFVLLFLTIKRFESKSVSIVVRHQQFFAVGDAGDRSSIPLSETHERLLQLKNAKKNIHGSEDPASINIRDSAGTRQVDDRNEKYTVGDSSVSQIDFENNTDDDDDEDDEDTINRTTLDDFLTADPQDTEYLKSNDVSDNDFDIESISGLKKIFRKKRSAHEQWKNSLPGAEPLKTTEDSDPDVWEEVTDAELQKAQIHAYKQVAIYLGWTLLSVVGFVIVGICFLRDPIACIFAFGAGCPCCLICCPCIRSFTDKYLDTKKLVREQMNKYMPGVIVNEDGTLDHYEPTGDELDILAELIDEMQD